MRQYRILSVGALLTALAVLTASAQRGGRLFPEAGQSITDLTCHTSDGKTANLKKLTEGKYAVIVFGCLTCPPFFEGLREREAIQRDYAGRGVRFFYVYKSLAHPGWQGYVKAETLDERLAHVAEMKRRFDTKWTWILDPMGNGLKHYFGDRNHSEFVINPAGVIVRARPGGDAAILCEDLATLIGPVEKPTPTDAIGPVAPPPDRGLATESARTLKIPASARPLVVKPDLGQKHWYLKLHAAAEYGVLRSGAGKLYLSFQLDPLQRVHWNNEAPPLEFVLEGPSPMMASPSTGRALKVEAEADSGPRVFRSTLSHVRLKKHKSVTVLAKYHACHDDEKWCRPFEQTYTIELKVDPDGGVTSVVADAVPSGRPLPSGGARTPATVIWSRLRGYDLNGDGKITRKEAEEYKFGRFDEYDVNKNGELIRAEIEKYYEARRREAENK